MEGKEENVLRDTVVEALLDVVWMKMILQDEENRNQTDRVDEEVIAEGGDRAPNEKK